MGVIKPVAYQDLLNQDKKLQEILGEDLKDEIEHYKRTCELYISLFDNVIRTYPSKGAVDCTHLLGVRIFQDSRAAFDLALIGIQPQSSSLVRGALEAIFLIYDFKFNPENEAIWFEGSKNKREELFKPSMVRNRLEGKIKSHEAGKQIYRLISDFSTHVSVESCYWYMETTPKTLKYHWAGRKAGERSAMMVLQAMFALSQALFVLVEEDIYTFTNSAWLDEYDEWKKAELEVNKKFGRLIGNNILEAVVFKPSPRVKVGHPK